MTAIEVEVAGPSTWVHRRTPVAAMNYDGTEGSRAMLATWISQNGGRAELRVDGSIVVLTPTKWAFVQDGWWVVRGYRGQFFVIDNDVFTGCYDPSGGPEFNAILNRDQAAAIVVEVDNMIAVARESTAATVTLTKLERAAEWIHQLATTAEALR